MMLPTAGADHACHSKTALRCSGSSPNIGRWRNNSLSVTKRRLWPRARGSHHRPLRLGVLSPILLADRHAVFVAHSCSDGRDRLVCLWERDQTRGNALPCLALPCLALPCLALPSSSRTRRPFVGGCRAELLARADRRLIARSSGAASPPLLERWLVLVVSTSWSNFWPNLKNANSPPSIGHSPLLHCPHRGRRP